MNEKLPAPCEACRGSGLRHGAVCSECQGKGYRLFIDGRQTPVQQRSPQRWQKARNDEHIKLAENITDRATQLFDEAIILERNSAAPTR
jgi:hypothetical protein